MLYTASWGDVNKYLFTSDRADQRTDSIHGQLGEPVSLLELG